MELKYQYLPYFDILQGYRPPPLPPSSLYIHLLALASLSFFSFRIFASEGLLLPALPRGLIVLPGRILLALASGLCQILARAKNKRAWVPVNSEVEGGGRGMRSPRRGE